MHSAAPACPSQKGGRGQKFLLAMVVAKGLHLKMNMFCAVFWAVKQQLVSGNNH